MFSLEPSERLCNGGSCAVCPKIAEMDKKIAEAWHNLYGLMAERQDLKTKQNSIHDPFILRLPTELSSKILTLCLHLRPLEEVGDSWYNKHPRGSTLREITTICHGWRTIALSTPQLWTRIRVRLSDVKTVKRDYLDFIKRLLARSGSLPLSLHIQGLIATPRTRREPKQDDYLPLIDALNEHSARWNFIQLNTHPSVIPLLRGCGTPSKVLDTLLMDTYSPARNDISFRLKAGPPSPLRVHVAGILLKLVDINWSRAANVTLSSATLDEFLELLAEAPRLEILKIGLAEWTSDIQQSPVHIIAPSLRNLNIRSIADRIPLWPSFLNVFGRLSLPRLEVLQINRFENIIGFADFISRSSCLLSSFEITEHQDDHHITLNELARAPSLQQLVICSATMDIEAVLERLLSTSIVNESVPSSGEPFLPNLQRLRLWGTIGGVMNWSLIPAVFPLADEFQTPGTRVRPFNDLALSLVVEPDNFDNLGDYFIPEADIGSLQNIIDNGYSLVVGTLDEDDLIERSRQFHAGLLTYSPA